MLKICCYLLGLALVNAAKPSVYCSTPNRNLGVCVPLRQCDNKTQSAKYIGLKDGCKMFQCCKEETNKQGLRNLNNYDYCGKFNKKIVGEGGRPWMALLFYRNFTTSSEAFKCSGSLISAQFVLTSANCVNIPQGNLTRIRLGEHHMKQENYCRNSVCEKKYEDFGIKKVISHERYQTETYQDDIALIKLDRSVHFNQHIRPICLPLNHELRKIDQKQNFFVAGWSSKLFVNPSTVLREGNLKLHRIKNCKFFTSENRKDKIQLVKTQFCASFINKTACIGDSGSPLYRPNFLKGSNRMIQYGIQSYVSLFCNGGIPGVYTNLIQYIPWISQNIVQ